MVRSTLALALAVALAMAPSPATGAELFSASDMESDDSMWALYERWAARYQVVREPAEKMRRFSIFQDTVRQMYAAHPGDRHYTLGLNIFADRTTAEVRATYACAMPADVVNTGAKKQVINVTPPPPPPPEEKLEELPDTVDWRKVDCGGHPCLTKVRDQGDCGCCWAMAATGALESLNAIQRKNGLVDLSVQQLVDCDKVNHNCSGGFAYKAYGYIVSNGGLASEAAYPYKGRVDTCQAAASSPVVAMAGFNWVTNYNPVRLMSAVRQQPVVVAIDANDTSFVQYPGGVYRGPCTYELNHEMLLVGYGSTGTTFDDLDYWIVKNSYGENWGENGYMRIWRNSDRGNDDSFGVCGIQTDSVYPYFT